MHQAASPLSVLRLFAFFALVAAMWCGCGPPPHARVLTDTAPNASAGDYAPEIKSEAMWRLLASRPATEHMARSEVVKVIVDRSDGQIYFLESKRWPVHFFFAERYLDKPGNRVPDQAVFNTTQYKSDSRRFVLGSLTHFLDADRWVFDLFAGDMLSLDATAAAFNQIKAKVFFGDRLAYRPVPPDHERDIARARTLMPVVTTDELFGKLKYQPLELGEAFGYLKVIAKGETFDPHALRAFDIVVLGEQPEDIPVVSGVITDELQAPLGHINVLCHNRKTPNMALRGASSSDEVKALAGKLVRVAVGAQTYVLEPATQAQAEASWAKRRPATGFKPERDDRNAGFPLLKDLDRKDVSLVGAKTAQLAFISHVLPAGVTPRGFALPFWAYARFMKDNGFDAKLSAMLDDPAFKKDPEERHKRLDALRVEMTQAPVPKDILTSLAARIKEVLPRGKVRLRSSTNAEDLPGFNGAGLYRSTRVNPDDEADLTRGLREVWASTWIWAAFEEREFYRIDAHTVGMAILVQESIDDDFAIGVAITGNPFSQGNPGYFINVQLSSGSVTGARGDEIPEQVLVYTYETGEGMERLSKSSRANGEIIMSDEVVMELKKRLDAVHIAFTNDPAGASGRAVDVEFLVRRTAPRVVLVQARPFTVTWSDDRRWLDADNKPVIVP
jgi:hypothetical protein